MALRQRMFKRVLKLIISVAFYAGDRLWETLRLLAGKEPRSTYVIVYYHSIPPEERSQFARQMEVLARLTRPIKLGAPIQWKPGTRYSSVTFDDVFANVVEHAVPELQKWNLPATFFITSGRMGQKADWWPKGTPEQGEVLVSGEQLRLLPDDIVTIGSHSVSHLRFTFLAEARVRQELVESREALEHTLERKITFFSFPYGAFDETVVDLCRQAGYDRVYTTVPVLASFHDEFVTGRIGVDPSDWSCEFHLKILGAYRWLPYAFSLKRKVLLVLKRPVKAQQPE